jgi:hypothetical protein
MELDESPIFQPASPARTTPQIGDGRRALAILAHHLRGGLEAAPDHDSIESIRFEKVGREQKLLIEWAKENQKLRKSFPEGDGSGGEHIVHLDVKAGRYFKTTNKNGLGYGVAVGSYCRGATPSEYLDRLSLQNELFNDDIRLEYIALRDRVPVIVTSQRIAVGDPAIEPEIIAVMVANGYEHLAPGTFYLAKRGLLMYDLHPRNAIKDAKRGVQMIDPVIQRVLPDFADFIREHPESMRNI